MKTHPFHGQILALSEIMVEGKIKTVKNRQNYGCPQWKRGNSTEDLFERVSRRRLWNKEVKEEEYGLKLERIITHELILV